MFEPDSLSAGVYDRELRVSLASRGYRQERTCSLPEPAFLLPSKYQCPNNRLSLGMEVLEAASNAALSPTGISSSNVHRGSDCHLRLYALLARHLIALLSLESIGEKARQITSCMP